MSVPVQVKVLEALLLSAVRQSDRYRSQSGERLARRWDAAIDQTIRLIAESPLLSSVLIVHQRSGIEIRRRRIEGFPRLLLLYHFDLVQNAVVLINIVHGAQELERALGQSAISEEEE